MCIVYVANVADVMAVTWSQITNHMPSLLALHQNEQVRNLVIYDLYMLTFNPACINIFSSRIFLKVKNHMQCNVLAVCCWLLIYESGICFCGIAFGHLVWYKMFLFGSMTHRIYRWYINTPNWRVRDRVNQVIILWKSFHIRQVLPKIPK